MKKQLILFLATVVVIAFACQKELSFESPNTPAKGSLKDDALGDCLPQTVNGAYVAGTALVPATNSIVVQVDVAQAGTYTVYTDTVNGYYFRTTGVFTNTGLTNVTLRSNGTPFAAGIDNFVVTFDTTFCDIAVTVLPAGTGAAVYTANCAGATVNGTYQVGTNLTASNTIVIPLTSVTTAGIYNINASVNGMTFTGSGSLTLSSTSITLTGVTTTSPTGPAGTYNLSVGSCSIPITVTGGAGTAVYTMNCAGATVNGTYQVGVNLTASNTIVIPLTSVTTAGTYNINVSVNGMTFTGSGSLTLSSTSITLTGVTTTSPTGPAGTYNLSVGSCSIPITVTGGLAVCSLNGSPGNCAGATVNGIYVVGGTLTASHTVVLNVTVTTAGSYNVTTTSAAGGLTFAGTGSLTTSSTTITLTATQPATVSGNNSFTVSVNGSGSCTFTVYVLPNDYYPRTTNSNWSYEWDDVATDSVMRTATSNTISAAGNTFTIFMQNDGVTPPPDSAGYYRRNGTDYFEWFDFGSWVGYDNPLWVEYTMLQSAANENVAWKSPPTGGWAGTAGGNNFNLRFSYKILTGQKNVPIPIPTSTGSVTYQDVIVVEERIEMEVGGNWQDITGSIDYYGKSYYARGIGLIKFEALNAASVVQAKMELRRWVVL